MQHLEEMKQKENKELEVSSPGSKRKLESVIEKKKKRSKQHRMLKTTLAILKPDSQTVQEEKAANFARAYFWKVKSRLTGTVFNHFIQELVNFETSKSKNVADLYRHVESCLAPHTDLIDGFLTFLLPYQALEIGRFIDHFLLIKMKEFCAKLEGCLFPKQVQQVLNTLEHLAGTPNVTLSDVHNSLFPYLKSSPLLSDYFCTLLPGERPPDSLQQLTECENMDCSDEQNKECVETILVPDCYDPYGGENCPCSCHISQIVHCTACGVKFINGRVYMQYGKILRPAKVVFKGENQNEILESKWRFVGNSKARTQSYKRIHPSPFKSHTSHNYDDHRIGIESEDDFSLEQGKNAPANKKSPKPPRMKATIGSKHKNTTKHASRKEETSGKEINSLVEGVTTLVAENFKEQIETSNRQFFLNKKDYVSIMTVHTRKCEILKDVITEPVDVDKVTELYVEKENVSKENFKKSKSENSSNDKVNTSNEKEELCMPIEEKFEIDDNYHLDCKVAQSRNLEESVLGPVFDVDNLNRISNELDECIKDKNNRNQNTVLLDYSEKAENSEQVAIAEETNHVDNTAISQDIVNYIEEKQVTETENKKIIPSDNSVTNCYVNVNITEGNIFKNKCKVNMNEVSCQKAEIEINEYSEPAKGELKMSVSLSNRQNKTPKSTKIAEVLSWTREEDKIILQAFQQETDTEQTFKKINQRLSNRSVEEIQTRFQILMQLLKEMTSVSQDGSLQSPKYKN